jgi:transposase InsO family protein
MTVARLEQKHDGLIHHSDRGVQYVSIRYTERREAPPTLEFGQVPRRHGS